MKKKEENMILNYLLGNKRHRIAETILKKRTKLKDSNYLILRLSIKPQ